MEPNPQDHAPDASAAFDPKCRTGGKCPITNAHRRLNAAHRHWHQTQWSYPDPDAFSDSLNACIQVMRSVTWMLKKSQRHIPDFEAWYAPWEQKFRGDPVMRWIVQARNRIEKEGDLDTLSTVRVQVLASYGTPVTRDFTVDPLLSTDEIAQRIEVQDLPPDVREDAVLVVERRWVASDLRDRELLDALSYAYGLLAEIISDAHVQMGFPPVEPYRLAPDESLEKVEISNSVLRGRLPCMLDANIYRTVHVKLGTGEIGFLRKSRPIQPSPEKVAGIVERYGFDPEKLAQKPQTLREEVAMYLNMAKGVLAADGYHQQIAFLHSDEDVQLVQVASADRADNLANWQFVAKEVEKVGAHTVIVIGESWFAPHDPAHPNRPAAESPKRIEVLSVDGINEKGEEEKAMVPFTREGERIVFGETQHLPGHTFYLDPIRRVWTRRSEGTKG